MERSEAPIILMADDDADDRLLVSDAFRLTKGQARLHFVEDGAELLKYLSEAVTLPSLILLDLNMPRKDGRQALKEIKLIPAFRDIPIVVLTTSLDKNDLKYCMETGAKHFITKPARFKEWVEIMKSLSDTWLVAK